MRSNYLRNPARRSHNTTNKLLYLKFRWLITYWLFRRFLVAYLDDDDEEVVDENEVSKMWEKEPTQNDANVPVKSKNWAFFFQFLPSIVHKQPHFLL